MNKFGLVVIGAHSGDWLKLLFEEYQNQNILLIEPVPYNITLLKENTARYKNINIETSAVSEKNQIKKFCYVKPDAVKKLGKHWASSNKCTWKSDKIWDERMRSYIISCIKSRLISAKAKN